MSGDADALAASLRALGDHGESVPLLEALTRVIEACVEMFHVQGAGLMLADEQGDLHYVAASEGPGRLLEKLQSEANEGPCVLAYVDNAVVVAEDAVADRRWPLLGEALSGQGVRAVLGMPVRLGGSALGSLDLYRDHAHEWQDDEISALRRYAEVIEGLLAAAIRAEQSSEVADQLQYALDYRIPIERGIGFLMSRDGLSSVQAFARLRTEARNSRRKVVDIARHLLRTGALPSESREQA